MGINDRRDSNHKPDVGAREIVSATLAGIGTRGATEVGGASTTPLSTVPTRIIVNGTSHMLALDPRSSLLDVLREQVGLTGAKKGCDHGQCGQLTGNVERPHLRSSADVVGGPSVISSLTYHIQLR
jgi:xanthine dehydrogenase YagT iron-sulfur-binding subunit